VCGWRFGRDTMPSMRRNNLIILIGLFLIIIVVAYVADRMNFEVTREIGNEGEFCREENQCELCQITYGGIAPPIYERAKCYESQCQPCPPFGDIQVENVTN
jgi:hypothetical protein